MVKKKVTTESKFFSRLMLGIGVLVIGGLGYAFLTAAPALPLNEIHLNAKQPKDCLTCHVEKIENAPIMPHRPTLFCISCHNSP